MTRDIRLAELVIGVEGLAIMRHLLRGEDSVVEARIDEIVAVIEKRGDQPLSARMPIPEMDYVTGYAAWSATYDRPNNPLISAEQPAVRAILDRLPIGSTLDVACGTGRHAAYLVEKGHHVIGIDQSKEMLAQGAGKARALSLARGDLHALPVRDASVDAVLCTLALSHVPDLGPALAEIVRVVRSDGSVVISDIHPFLPVLFGGVALFETAEGTFAYVRDFLHLHSDYLKAFREVGLDVEECQEVRIGPEEVEMQGFAYMYAPDATAAAFEGLPIALIWHLTKS